MRQLSWPAAVLALGLLPSAAIGAPVRWTALADCAAAYQANAQLVDKDRPASMTSQISDVAGDYAKAAARAYRRGGAHSARPVTARIARQASIYSARSREEVEKVIDACPQLDDGT